jgi:chemotaxis protein MotB
LLAKKKQAGGAPEWALTYGDMMSLLLCFFILLAAFADYEKGGGGGSSSVADAMQSIQEALGIKVPNPSVLKDAAAFNAMLEQIKKTVQDFNEKNRGNTREEGVAGKSFRLRRIRDGMEIVVGGTVLFEPFATKLTDDGHRSLEKLGEIVKGHRNKVDVIGHAAEQPAPSDWTYRDAMELSYSRAKCVAEELIKRGLDPRTVRIVAVGPNEPMRRDTVNPTGAGDDRRVEIVVRESLIDDYKMEQSSRLSADPPTAIAPK